MILPNYFSKMEVVQQLPLLADVFLLDLHWSNEFFLKERCLIVPHGIQALIIAKSNLYEHICIFALDHFF